MFSLAAEGFSHSCAFPVPLPFIIQVKESGRVFLLNVNQRGKFLCLSRWIFVHCASASCRVVPLGYSPFNFQTRGNLPSLFNVSRPTDRVSNLKLLPRFSRIEIRTKEREREREKSDGRLLFFFFFFFFSSMANDHEAIFESVRWEVWRG